MTIARDLMRMEGSTEVLEIWCRKLAGRIEGDPPVYHFTDGSYIGFFVVPALARID